MDLSSTGPISRVILGFEEHFRSKTADVKCRFRRVYCFPMGIISRIIGEVLAFSPPTPYNSSSHVLLWGM